MSEARTRFRASASLGNFHYHPDPIEGCPSCEALEEQARVRELVDRRAASRRKQRKSKRR